MLKQKLIQLIQVSKDFNDYENNIKNSKFENTKELGDVQEIFGQLYFSAYKKHYNIKRYISYLNLTEKKKQFLETFNLPSKDKGTDAVIIHMDNSSSLVQIKYRSKDEKHKRNVFSGLAIDALNCKLPIKNLYLFSNCSTVSEEGFKYDKKFKFILYDTLKDIDWDFFKSSISIENISENIFSKTIVFREWQKDAMEFTEKELSTENKLSVIAPCGAGKTLYAFGAIKKLFPNDFKVLVIVPTLYLLTQWYDSIAKYFDEDVNFLCVGSDFELREESSRFDITTTTKGVSKILKSNYNKLVVISTYQSLDKTVNSCEKLNFTFDLSFADEAHRTVTNYFSEDSNFSIITKENFPSKFKIYLTATPKIFKGKMIEKILSMDKKEIYGNQYRYSVRKAIVDNVISDYKIILGSCKENIGDGFPDSQKYDVYAKLLLLCIKKYEMKKVLVSSNTHVSSKKLYDAFTKMAKDEIDHKLMLVPKSCSVSKRNSFISDISRRKGIIFNVKVFSLGTDIPELDAVFFNGDKSSVIDIVQTAMRCMRKHPSKENAYIIVPAFFGADLKVECGDFPFVRNALSAMANQDEVLKEEIKLRCKNSFKEFKKTKLNQKIILVESLEKFGKVNLESIEDRLFNSLAEHSDDNMWFIICERVKLWIELHDRNLKNNPDDLEEKFFWKWCSHQKTSYTNKELKEDRIKELEKIKGWKWAEIYSFEKRCGDLAKWVDENGKIPSKASNSTGSLEDIYGGWCDAQRQRKKKGLLTPDEIKTLENIKGWYWEGRGNPILETCKEVKKWVRENGRLPKNSTDPVEKKHGRWCTKQRAKYKKSLKDGNFVASAYTLSMEEVRKIETIKGWKWALRASPSDTTYEKVKEWVEKNGRMPRESAENEEERRYGGWCGRKREKNKKEKLEQDEIKLLGTIEGWHW